LAEAVGEVGGVPAMGGKEGGRSTTGSRRAQPGEAR